MEALNNQQTQAVYGGTGFPMATIAKTTGAIFVTSAIVGYFTDKNVYQIFKDSLFKDGTKTIVNFAFDAAFNSFF